MGVKKSNLDRKFDRNSLYRGSTVQNYVLATVDDDAFGHESCFQHALFGVVSAPAEQAGRLDTEIPDLLRMIVHVAISVLLHQGLIAFLDFLNTTRIEQRHVLGEILEAMRLWHLISQLEIAVFVMRLRS